MIPFHFSLCLLDDKQRIVKRDSYLPQYLFRMITGSRKTAILKKQLKIIPGRIFHYTECPKRNLIGIVLNLYFFMPEINVNHRTEIHPVHKIHPHPDIRIIAELVRLTDLVVNRLPGNAELPRNFSNVHSTFL